MSSKHKSAGRSSAGLLVFAVVTLSNPLINIFDYFPDLIGCFIIASALSFFADRAPYFAEARSGFLKLGLIGVIKIPSFIIMEKIISQNMRESDIRVLLSLVFAVVEVSIAVVAIKNIFTALSYLGQRSDAASLITPFSISKRSTMTPESLQIMCYAFVIARGVLNVLPECLRLTRTDVMLNPGYFNPALLYPYAILLSFLTVLVFGIIFSCRASSFIKAIYRENKIHLAAEGMIDEARQEQIKKEKKVKKLRSFASILAFSSFLLFDFCSRKLSDVNLLPDFIFGIVLIIALVKATRFMKKTDVLIISAASFTIVSFAKYVLEIIFLSNHTYEQISFYPSASAKYLPVILISAFEAVIFVVFALMLGKALIRFTRKRTGLCQKSEKYSAIDAEYHKDMKKKCIIWTILLIAIEAIKLAVTLTRGYISLSALTFIICLVFVSYSFYLFGKIKEEINNKYL